MDDESKARRGAERVRSAIRILMAPFRWRATTARRRLEERLDAVYVLGRELVLSRDEQQIAEAVVDAASFLLGCPLCELWLVDDAGQTLSCQAIRAAGEAKCVAKLRLDSEQSVVAAAARADTAIYLPDLRGEGRHEEGRYKTCPYDGGGGLSELCAPLVHGDEVIGVLNVESARVDGFDEGEQRLVATLAGQAALAIENARLYGQMRATHGRMRTLSRRLLEVQEAERRHIARELHDEVGQVLTGLKLLLEMSVSSPPELIGPRLDQALGLVDELATRVQELSLSLRPSMLDDLGLLPTLAWHFNRYTDQTGVRVNFHYFGQERRFAPAVRTAAYRIVQEALTNVARHADVTEVYVQLWVDPDVLRVQIEDEGTGFDTKGGPAAGDTSGVSGMHERAVLLGGQLTIDSAPGDGTCVIAELPLGDAAGAGAERPTTGAMK